MAGQRSFRTQHNLIVHKVPARSGRDLSVSGPALVLLILSVVVTQPVQGQNAEKHGDEMWPASNYDYYVPRSGAPPGARKWVHRMSGVRFVRSFRYHVDTGEFVPFFPCYSYQGSGTAYLYDVPVDEAGNPKIAAKYTVWKKGKRVIDVHQYLEDERKHRFDWPKEMLPAARRRGGGPD